MNLDQLKQTKLFKSLTKDEKTAQVEKAVQQVQVAINNATSKELQLFANVGEAAAKYSSAKLQHEIPLTVSKEELDSDKYSCSPDEYVRAVNTIAQRELTTEEALKAPKQNFDSALYTYKLWLVAELKAEFITSEEKASKEALLNAQLKSFGLVS